MVLYMGNIYVLVIALLNKINKVSVSKTSSSRQMSNEAFYGELASFFFFTVQTSLETRWHHCCSKHYISAHHHGNYICAQHNWQWVRDFSPPVQYIFQENRSCTRIIKMCCGRVRTSLFPAYLDVFECFIYAGWCESVTIHVSPRTWFHRRFIVRVLGDHCRSGTLQTVRYWPGGSGV